jgi:hypothetical protein
MTIKTAVQKESLAEKYADDVVEVSIHDGDPGTTGDNEVVAIPREPLTWTAGAVDGVQTTTASFAVPADTEVAYLGFWASDGSFRDSVEAGVSFISDGYYTINLSYTQE